MRKFLSILVAGSLVVESLLAPVSVMAQTTTSSTDISALIAQIEAQIKILQAQIEALRAARAQVASTTQQTIGLIRQLREGLSGDDVRLLQILLAADLDIYPEALITGFFGRKTAEAVRRFQRKHGLPMVGNVGPLTLEKLRKLLEERGVNKEKDDDDDDNDGRRDDERFCVIVPPGHLIAPGWNKKHDGRVIIRECGRSGKTTSTPPVIDTTAPIISEIEIDDRTSSGAKIKWDTNEFATSFVWFGTTALLTQSAGSNVLERDHSIRLTGLSASTTYIFQLVSKDASGNTATSSQQSFTTN